MKESLTLYISRSSLLRDYYRLRKKYNEARRNYIVVRCFEYLMKNYLFVSVQ